MGKGVSETKLVIVDTVVTWDPLNYNFISGG